MNRMELEKIKHEAAQDVFDGTGYHWNDMLDNTADIDRGAAKLGDKDDIRDYYMDYFTDLLTAIRWEDRTEIGRLK